jgi:hypothetical protein
MKKLLSLAVVAATITISNSGCQNTHSDSRSSGTHRMGTPKENYQMSDEDMPGGKPKRRPTGVSSSGSGTHRMGTPKENYQMSNEQMKRN